MEEKNIQAQRRDMDKFLTASINRPVFRNSATMKMFLWCQKEEEFKSYQKQHRKIVCVCLFVL
jgi:hypothetical protein